MSSRRAFVAAAAVAALSSSAAAQGLGGITGRDEYSAEPWARGGRPDAPQVLFDGLPVFGPTHAFGAYSAINKFLS